MRDFVQLRLNQEENKSEGVHIAGLPKTWRDSHLADGTAEMASSRNGQTGQPHHTYFRYFWVAWHVCGRITPTYLNDLCIVE